MVTSTGSGSKIELPPVIDSVRSFITRVCGVGFSLFCPGPCGAATQVLPFQVRTSPLFDPVIVKLSARTAVP